MSFRISALPSETFAPLFALDDAALQAAGGRRVAADAKPGSPCRVSLTDAEIGESLILLHYEHQPAPTPFRASHAVYVREGVTRADPAIGEVPAALRTRTLSLRGYDAADMLIAAELCEGTDAENAIAVMLADHCITYLHAHFAKPGCYAARVERA